MNNRDRRWYQSRVRQLEKRIEELEKLHKDCLSVIESQDERIAELEEQLMTEKEFGMHYHAEFMKLFKKGVE